MDLRYWFVPHTHWDREWYLSFQDFRWKLIRSIDQILETLRSDPDFAHFMLDGQTIVLEDYLEIRPEKREELAALIREGRVAVGPWYVQPDDILVTGEALIRNLERGALDAAAFGGSMRVGYLPDSFGHCAGLPAVLAGFGLESACFMRGAGPSLDKTFFTWGSRDGSQLLVAYLVDSYGNGADLVMEPGPLKDGLAVLEDRQGEARLPGVPLLVMNGTDHRSITAELPGAIAGAGLSGEARIGPLADYVELARPRLSHLPHWQGELRSPWRFPVIVGCTSARSWIKQEDQAVSALLETQAEPLAALASLLGEPYPAHAIATAWKHLLQNQPHDSICGCSIDQVHDDMRYRYAQARGLGANVAASAARELARRVALPAAPSGAAWMVAVNPGPARAAAMLSASAARVPPDPVLLDGAGVRHPVQLVAGGEAGRESAVFFDERFSPRQLAFAMGMVKDGRIMELSVQEARTSWESPTVLRVDMELATGAASSFDWAGWVSATKPLLSTKGLTQVHAVGLRSGAKTLLFSADLPAFSASAFRLEAGAGTHDHGTLHVRGKTLANHRYTVRVLRDGSLQIMDRVSGLPLKGVNGMVDDGDRGDEYNHDSPARDTVIHRPRSVRVTVAESGPVRATLRIRSSWSIPASLAPDRRSRSRKRTRLQVTRYVTLPARGDAIHFRTEVENTARDHRLRVSFPLPGAAVNSLAGGTFGAVRRSPGPEVFPQGTQRPSSPELGEEQAPVTHPFTGFVAGCADQAGVCILARGLREYELRPAALLVTLFRSVGFLSRGDLASRRANAGPDEPTPGAQGMGPQVFEYALLPFAGAADEAALSRAWEEFRSTPRVVALSSSDRGTGTVAEGKPLLEVADAGLIFSSLRRTGPHTLSLRAWDATGVRRQAEVRLPPGVTGARLTALDGSPRQARELHPATAERPARVMVPVEPWAVLTLELTVPAPGAEPAPTHSAAPTRSAAS